MDLARRCEALGIESERRQEAAAVFDHRIGAIVGRTAEVERVERRGAHPADSSRERECNVSVVGGPEADARRRAKREIPHPGTVGSGTRWVKHGNPRGALATVRRTLGCTVIVGFSILIVCAAIAQSPSSRPAANGSSGSAVATVGSRRIASSQFEREAEAALAEFERARGTKPSAEIARIIRRQILEREIRQNLLILEARKLNVPVSQPEIEAQFRTHPFFNSAGTFDSARFAKVKAANSPEYRQSLSEIKDELAAQKLALRLESEYSPDLTQLRDQVDRRLSRASTASLALRHSEFDGSYPEPREAEDRKSTRLNSSHLGISYA